MDIWLEGVLATRLRVQNFLETCHLLQLSNNLITVFQTQLTS